MNNTNSSVSGSSSSYKNIPVAPYVTFRNDLEDEDDDQSQQPTKMISGGGNNGGIKLVTSDMPPTNIISSSGDPGTSSINLRHKRVRLRALHSERDQFLKLMNLDIIRVLVIVQVAAAVVIVISQVILYAIPTDYRRIADYIGGGIWAPILFFAPSCWLTYLTMKSPSGCSLGSALACQIMSVIVGFILVVLSIIHLLEHGSYSRWRNPNSEEWDPEVPGRVFTSFMILAAICVTVASIITSIQYCKLTCCGRSNHTEPTLYDVDIVNV